MSPISLSQLSRSIVHEITPYEPGKPIAEVQREYGVTDVIKLASNENPLGASPKAIAALKAAMDEIHRYPDGAGFTLKEKLSQHHKLPAQHFVLGNGSTELVELVTEAFVESSDNVVIGLYEFFKYRIAVQIMNATTKWVEMPNLEYDVDATLAAIDSHTKVVFIANPNNPTGTLMNREDVERFMAKVPSNVIVVFDEAYYDYRDPETYPDTIPYIVEGRNVIVMRTFSKSYGLASLRVGYAITTPELAQAMNTVREAFNVNSLAQTAAAAALDDHEFLARSIEVNNKGKEFFYRELARLNLHFVPTGANFVLIETPIPGRELFRSLLRLGVVVRPVDGYGLPMYVRVSIGLPDENKRFISALESVLSGNQS